MPQKKPEWLKKRITYNDEIKNTRKILKELKLNTVCESARCPNLSECFARSTATFMIMGNKCTRNCKFCAVPSGKPEALKPEEPEQLAAAVDRLKLKHVVITSVTRDDLKDGGAAHFSKCVQEIKKIDRDIVIELLIPDLKLNRKAIKTVVDSSPHIINHNLETVPELYSKVRPEAEYKSSLKVLSLIKKMSSDIYTKSGIMVGLGESEAQVIAVMKDLRNINCDILTIGQYLQPTQKHLPVQSYIKPEQFEKYEDMGKKLGFKYIASGPYVRSSYQAEKFSERYFSE
ncbi:MAG: lipoyl synthase [Bacillota bacterium]